MNDDDCGQTRHLIQMAQTMKREDREELVRRASFLVRHGGTTPSRTTYNRFLEYRFDDVTIKLQKLDVGWSRSVLEIFAGNELFLLVWYPSAHQEWRSFDFAYRTLELLRKEMVLEDMAGV